MFTSDNSEVHCYWVVGTAYSLAVLDADFERRPSDFLKYKGISCRSICYGEPQTINRTRRSFMLFHSQMALLLHLINETLNANNKFYKVNRARVDLQ